MREATAPRLGGPDVSLRLLRPDSPRETLPALLWFHGGGQVLGYAAQDDPFLKRLCAEIGCVAVSVDYRLAPEARSPAAAEDGVRAYEWLRSQSSTLGVDIDRIGIAGASGGGGIAAAVALMIRDRGLPAPLFQSLSYPMIDDRNVSGSSHEVTDIGIWDRAANVLAWQAILGDAAGREGVSPYQAPARAARLGGLPPTFLAVGDLDLFRDEDLDYAMRLVAAGVPVDLHLFAGAYHFWDVLAPESRLAKAFTQTWFDYLSRQFGKSSQG